MKRALIRPNPPSALDGGASSFPLSRARLFTRRHSDALPPPFNHAQEIQTRFEPVCRNRGTEPMAFSALLTISPGEIPKTNANRPSVSTEGLVFPCSKQVMKERANPDLTDNSFLERPRASLSFVSSAGNAFFKRSAQSSAPMDFHRYRAQTHFRGSLFRSVLHSDAGCDSLTRTSFFEYSPQLPNF